jgi:hypothetical protein
MHKEGNNIRDLVFSGNWSGYGPPSGYESIINIGVSKYTDEKGGPAIYLRAGCREGYMDVTCALTFALALCKAVETAYNLRPCMTLVLTRAREGKEAMSIRRNDVTYLQVAAQGVTLRSTTGRFESIDFKRWNISFEAPAAPVIPDIKAPNATSCFTPPDIEGLELERLVPTLLGQLPDDHILKQYVHKGYFGTAGTRGVQILTDDEAKNWLEAYDRVKPA